MPIRPEARAPNGQNRHLNETARRARLAPGYPDIQCEECGVQFSPYRMANIRFCSTRCRKRRAYKDANPKTPKPCAWCGEIFVPTKSTKRAHCRPECRSAKAKDALRSDPARMERLRAKQRKYSATPQYRHSQANHKAKRRAVMASGGVTLKEWTAIVEQYENRCAYCGDDTAKLTIDHVVPLSREGVHEPSNVVPACGSCNSSKGDRDWSDRLRCP